MINQELKFIGKLDVAESKPTFKISADYILLRLQKISEANEATFSDQIKALDLLGKYKQLWQGDHNINVNVGEFIKDLTTSNVGYDDLLAKPGWENTLKAN